MLTYRGEQGERTEREGGGDREEAENQQRERDRGEKSGGWKLHSLTQRKELIKKGKELRGE